MRYTELEKFLEKRLKHGRVEIIGQSVLNRYIYAVFFDCQSDKTAIIQGAIHAREHITCDLICRLISDMDNDFDRLKALGCANLVFVPMCNPDGAELCQEGIKSVKDRKVRRFLKLINGSKDFSLFKANANGVDLNCNFDAKWGSGKGNLFVPSSEEYVGSAPMSEPEVQALAYLTKKVNPFFTISYHCKGEEIYYEFWTKQQNIKRDKCIARIIARSTGYKLVSLNDTSSGGYKDWCIQRLSIPSVTIEVGQDKLKHPLDKSALKQIYKRNRNILKCLCKIKKVSDEYDKRRKVYENGSDRGGQG